MLFYNDGGAFSAFVSAHMGAACDEGLAGTCRRRPIGSLGAPPNIAPNFPHARPKGLPLLPIPASRCSSLLRGRLGVKLDVRIARKVGASHHHPSGSPFRSSAMPRKLQIARFAAIPVLQVPTTTFPRARKIEYFGPF